MMRIILLGRKRLVSLGEDEENVDIYADISTSKLVALADEVNVEVISVTENNESLESYFMNLVAGKDGYL